MEENNTITKEEIIALNSSDVSYMSKIVLLYLLDKQGREISLARLAQNIGTIKQSVIVALDTLERNGYLTIDKSRRNGNMYFLTDKLNGVKHESRTE